MVVIVRILTVISCAVNFAARYRSKSITWGTHTSRVSLLPLLMITGWVMRAVVPVWGIEKHQGGLSDSRKQIVQL